MPQQPKDSGSIYKGYNDYHEKNPKSRTRKLNSQAPFQSHDLLLWMPGAPTRILMRSRVFG